MVDSTTTARPRRFRTLRALFMVLAFGLNLVLLLGVGLYLLNDDDYRRVVIWSADYFLDSRLEIDGAFSVRFGHEVELTAESVRLKAYDGSYDLSVGKLNVEQRFGSYLSTGTLWINHLNIEDLRGEIRETGNEEGFDWQAFSLPYVVMEEIQISNLSLAYTEFDRQRHTIELSHVSLYDTDNQGPVKVSAAGVINEHSLQLDGTLGSLKQLRSNNQTYPIDFILSGNTGDAELDKQIIELNGTVGHTLSGHSQMDAIFDVDIPELVPIFNQEVVADKLGHLQGSVIVVEDGGRWRISKTQFAATGTDAYQLRVGGAVENTGQFDLHSEFGVADPAAFGARFGIDLTRYAPFKSKGLISGNKNKLNYQGKMSIGRIENDTTLAISLRKGKPSIKGKLTIPKLYLADIGINQLLGGEADATVKANAEGSKQPESAAPVPEIDAAVKANPDGSADANRAESVPASADRQTIFNHEPLDFTGLQYFNLDLEISIGQVIGADYSSGRLAGRARLTDGLLRVSPLRMTFDGGSTDLELAVDTRETPSVELKMMADDLLLTGLLTKQQQELPVKGSVKLHMDISSKGRSAHELVSALAGKVDLVLENVSFPAKYLEYLSADVQKSSTASDTDSRIQIDGAVTLNLGKEAGLIAEAVHVTTDDGSYDISLGKLHIQPELASYLETGTLWFRSLSITDLRAEIMDIDTSEDHDLQGSDWHEFAWQVSRWPFVLIEKMRLGNLSLTYTEDDQRHTASVSSLVLDNDNSEEPLQVSVAGTLNARALKLEGTVGTAAQSRGKNQVYPIDFALSGGTVDATPNQPIIKLNGSIDRTVPGASLMDARFDVAVTELVSIFNQERTVSKLGHLQGSVSVAEADGRWGIRKINVGATDTDMYQLHMEGEVDDANKLDLRSEIEVPDPAALGAQFGIDLTGYAAYQGKGVLSGTQDKLSYQGHVSIGRIQNETTLTISLVEGKPFVQGKFIIPELYLPDIGLDYYLGVDPDASVKANPHAGEQQKSAEPALVAADSQTIFDREPLDFTGLQYFNLDLEILIDQITGVDFSIDKLEGEIGLTDGALRLSPMRMTFQGGATDLELELVTRNTPSVKLRATAVNLILENLIAKVQKEVQVKGKAHLNIDITSSGHSAHELASDLSGEVSFSLENARVPKKYVELITADLFGFLMRAVTFENSYTTLNCAMGGFDIDQGVVKSKLLFGEGPNLSIQATATLDLGQETIDMVLLPREKKRLRLNISKINVRGSLADPDVETTSGRATVEVVSGALVIPEIVVPVFLIGKLFSAVSSGDDDSGCKNYVKQHKAQ